MVPLAIGTQTNGSLIRPAYCCVYGYKPTHGLSPVTASRGSRRRSTRSGSSPGRSRTPRCWRSSSRGSTTVTGVAAARAPRPARGARHRAARRAPVRVREDPGVGAGGR
ncbi:MAG TPA: hypothetical protein VGW35_19610 [Methylomirabilota bacterium]|nr:hypothetical protein [Methylomirabilota bacterium]